MKNEHTSLEKYTSPFIRKSCVRDELVTEQTATYWPPSSSVFAAFLSHSAGLLYRGSWGPKPSAGSWFSLPRTPNWCQLTRTVCGTRLYNCWMPTCFLWVSHLHRIQPVHMLRWWLWPDAPVSRLMAGSKVNMLQKFQKCRSFGECGGPLHCYHSQIHSGLSGSTW